LLGACSLSGEVSMSDVVDGTASPVLSETVFSEPVSSPTVSSPTVLSQADLAAVVPAGGVTRGPATALRARLTALLRRDIDRVQGEVITAVSQQVRHEQGRIDRAYAGGGDPKRAHHGHNQLYVDRD
jgi:hypothetical protein